MRSHEHVCAYMCQIGYTECECELRAAEKQLYHCLCLREEHVQMCIVCIAFSCMICFEKESNLFKLAIPVVPLEARSCIFWKCHQSCSTFLSVMALHT